MPGEMLGSGAQIMGGINGAPGGAVATAPGPELGGKSAFAGLAVLEVGSQVTDTTIGPDSNPFSWDVYAPGVHDIDMLGGRATPFDSNIQTVLAPSAEITAQAQQIALYTALYGVPAAPSIQIEPTFDVISQAEEIAAIAWGETKVVAEARQIAQKAWATDAIERPVVQEVTLPAQAFAVRESVFSAEGGQTNAKADAAPVMIAVAQEAAMADAELAAKAEDLALSLGLDGLAQKMAEIKAVAVGQADVVTAELHMEEAVQAQEEVAVQGEVEAEVMTQTFVNGTTATSLSVAREGQIINDRVLSGEEQAVPGDEVARPAAQQVLQDKSGGQGKLVEEGPIRAREENERRKVIAREVVEGIKGELKEGEEASGSNIAEKFKQRANAEASSPILQGQGQDGSVDYIVAPLEGKTFEDPDTPVSVLQQGTDIYTAIEKLGENPDATNADLQRVYSGARRGMIVAA